MHTNNHISNWVSLTDTDIVREMGKALKAMRLHRNMTQQEIARHAGIDRVTISKMENGSPVTLLTVIQLLRALDELDVLEPFHQHSRTSPLQAARLNGKTRKRASRKK